jgi:hypothetical protein
MTQVEHEGPGHGDVTLSLTEETAGGGRHYRSWNICECSPLVQRLREVLPEPAHESLVSPEAVRATAAAVRAVPGAVHLGEGF